MYTYDNFWNRTIGLKDYMFTQLIITGISIGSIYALMALAMSIIYKTSEVPNFAQGEMAMVATFVAYLLQVSFQLPVYYALAGALLFAILLGGLVEFLFLRRAKNPSPVDLVVITIGIQLMLQGLAGWKFGSEQKEFPFPILDNEVVNIGPVVASQLNLLTIAISLTLMLLLFLFFKYTRLGIAMKATQQNPVAARINGIRTNRILSITWGISSFIGAVAGILLAPTATLDPYLMWEPLIKGFAAAVLGGMTSLAGAVLGGYLLGIIENLFGAYISLEFKSTVAFFVIVLVLWFRPSGLFSKHFERKV